MGTFTIGKLADAAGVHVETIRYYERRGLLAQPPRSPSGYRLYSADDLWRLQVIARGKRLGFTLAEIADVLGAGRSACDMRAAAQAKLAAIEHKQEELARVHHRLEQLVDLCAHGNDADCLALNLG
jgi:MerR family mercuric resistance operon transcriptional regulator